VVYLVKWTKLVKRIFLRKNYKHAESIKPTSASIRTDIVSYTSLATCLNPGSPKRSFFEPHLKKAGRGLISPTVCTQFPGGAGCCTLFSVGSITARNWIWTGKESNTGECFFFFSKHY
jgi:hypothetical protein